jgi:hypothetical protein
LRLSDNGRRLLAAVEASSVYHIYLYDLETTNRALIDHRYDLPATPGDWESDSPAFDPDGRFIIYRSLARDIVPDDSNDQPDIFLYDCQTGLNSLLFTGQNGNGSPNHRSLLPLFSADGDTLLFASGASDVASYDHNHNTDIFACAFLRALIFPGSTPGEGPWLSWPWVPDSGYRVEYKNILSDPNWEVLPGTITNLGVKAWLQDRSPGPNQRFYRIISF